MKRIKLKKTDISRILHGLSLLEMEKQISKKHYIRLYKKLFKELK